MTSCGDKRSAGGSECNRADPLGSCEAVVVFRTRVLADAGAHLDLTCPVSESDVIELKIVHIKHALALPIVILRSRFRHRLLNLLALVGRASVVLALCVFYPFPPRGLRRRGQENPDDVPWGDDGVMRGGAQRANRDLICEGLSRTHTLRSTRTQPGWMSRPKSSITF